MKIADIRRQNLAALLAHYSSQRELAERTNTPPAYISQCLNGTRNLGNAVARRIESMVGLPEGWFDTATVPPTLESAPVRGAPYVDIPVASQSDRKRQTSNNAISGFMRLSDLWARRHLPRVDPGDLEVWTAWDDCMLPIAPGDVLILNRTAHTIDTDGVYLIEARDELFVRRVQRHPDGRLLLICDNTLYPPTTIDPAAINVLGRVCWAWIGRSI